MSSCTDAFAKFIQRHVAACRRDAAGVARMTWPAVTPSETKTVMPLIAAARAASNPGMR